MACQTGCGLAPCSAQWDMYMTSLKDATETGKGQPFHNAVLIDHDRTGLTFDQTRQIDRQR